MFYPSHQSL